MNLLEKFTAVSIETDRRITEDDRAFCETHQSAYAAALQALSELSFFWEDAQKTQDRLESLSESHCSDNYLYSYDGLKISEGKINEQFCTAHAKLIESIVRYFNANYHITASAHEIEEKLTPQKPDRYSSYDIEAHKKYNEKMRALRLRYQDIVDLIILQLDGRNFAEQAFFELRRKCREAANNPYSREARYERKKHTLVWTDYGCSYDDSCYTGGWKLQDGTKAVLRGIAHFETGSFTALPEHFSRLLDYKRTFDDLWLFPDCKKLEQIKMFKNGRVDFRFVSEADAQEFEETYLSSVGGAA